MGELATTLAKARPVVNWFALGEAKAITHEIDTAINIAHKKGEADPQVVNKLKEVATKAVSFLSEQLTEEARKHVTAIRNVLNKTN